MWHGDTESLQAQYGFAPTVSGDEGTLSRRPVMVNVLQKGGERRMEEETPKRNSG